jgi:hypothetical protein
MREIKGEQISSDFTQNGMKRQVQALYEILVNKIPRFYPIKHKVRAKTAQGRKYWIKYWEEHPIK